MPNSRILLVDDDPQLLRSLGRLMRVEGYDIELAASGAEALACFAVGRFDLMITDFSMPVMDGDQLATAIKSIAPFFPIILLTGHAERFLSPRQQPPGVNSVLPKPTEFPVLRQTIEHLLAQ